MPIKIVSVYAASDGQTFASEDDAKAHEIDVLWTNSSEKPMDGKWVVNQSAEIISILTTRPDAPPRRKPRSDRGKNHAKRNSVPAKEGVA